MAGLWKRGGVGWYVFVLLKFHMPMATIRVRSDNERGTSGESDADDVSAMTVWQDGCCSRLPTAARKGWIRNRICEQR